MYGEKRGNIHQQHACDHDQLDQGCCQGHHQARCNCKVSKSVMKLNSKRNTEMKYHKCNIYPNFDCYKAYAIKHVQSLNIWLTFNIHAWNVTGAGDRQSDMPPPASVTHHTQPAGPPLLLCYLLPLWLPACLPALISWHTAQHSTGQPAKLI